MTRVLINTLAMSSTKTKNGHMWELINHIWTQYPLRIDCDYYMQGIFMYL
jgi:hypothetical protein